MRVVVYVCRCGRHTFHGIEAGRAEPTMHELAEAWFMDPKLARLHLSVLGLALGAGL